MDSSTGSYVEALFGKTLLNSANDTTKVSYSSDTRNAAYRNTLILVHCNDFLGKAYPSFEWAFVYYSIDEKMNANEWIRTTDLLRMKELLLTTN